MTSSNTMRPAGHCLVEALIEQGVDTAFGVPGESFLAALDGFYEHRDRIRFIACRQEGGAAYMADAQGKLSGRPGVCFVTRGPGASNAAVGLHTAFQDSTPMVLFIGQVARDQRDREAFQEVDYRQMFGPGTLGFAKWVGEIEDADRLPEYVARAWRTAMQGRPGPVVLVLPEDMLTTPTAAPVLPRVEPAVAWPAPGALRDLRVDADRRGAAVRDRRRERLGRRVVRGVPALRRGLAVAGRLRLPLPGPVRQRASALRRRRRHRHQSEAGAAHRRGRPGAGGRPAPRRDDDRRLCAAEGAAAAAEARPRACRRRGTRARLRGRPDAAVLDVGGRQGARGARAADRDPLDRVVAPGECRLRSEPGRGGGRAARHGARSSRRSSGSHRPTAC